MYRRKISELIEKNIKDPDAPILLVNGARQIGKSFICRTVAKSIYPHYVEINLQDDFDGGKNFAEVNGIRDFYLRVSALYGARLGSYEDTIIFLDEIQVYPRLISMLKPLKADRRFHYICSGSQLGVAMRFSFIPMGSVRSLSMRPMDFEEFLWARGAGRESIDSLRESFGQRKPLSQSSHEFFFKAFKEYLLCGGLPEAVKAFLEEGDVYKMREIQSSIYESYKGDMSRYDQTHSLKTRRIYDSLLSYAQNKVKRLRAKQIEGDVRASLVKYEDEIDYLVDSGCALPVKAVSDPRFPLGESSAKDLMKLYYNDVGILTYLLFNNNVKPFLNDVPSINLGSVYETVVAQELIAHGHQLFYFDSKKVGEVDYLVNDYDSLSILPIEVKSGRTGYEYRALPKLVDPTGHYRLGQGMVLQNANRLDFADNILTAPIYMVMFV